MEQPAENVSAINTRLKQVRKALKLKQDDFAELIGVSRPYLTNIEAGRNKVAFEIVTFLIETQNISAHWFHTGQGGMFVTQTPVEGQANGQVNGQVISPTKTKGTKKDESERVRTEIIVATQDTRGNATFSVVNQKAAANFLSGYQSQEYYRGLGAVTLPRALVGGQRQGILLQIDGDSMTPKYQPGDWVACVLLDRSEWREIINSDCYVVVSASYGIQFKRLRNHMAEGYIQCHSDNRRHRPFIVEENDLLQLYHFVLHVSPDGSNPDVDLHEKVDSLEDTTTDLRMLYEQVLERMSRLEAQDTRAETPENAH